MYLDELAAKIRGEIPSDRLPEGDADALFRIYAVLLRAKGTGVAQSDVHDAWSAWLRHRDHTHDALVPYEELSEGVREQDRIFAEAIRKVAKVEGYVEPTQMRFGEALFPFGPPASDEERRQTFELYKIMVDSSEALVGRRQGVNTFFLTMNGALLTAVGIIVQSSGNLRLGGIAVTVLAIAGAILCGAWRSLIRSFGQLNRGKFKVINTIERYLTVGIYAAEWEALGRGEDPSVYRSFTSREIWVPNALLVVHALAALGGFLIALGVLSVPVRT